MAKRPSGNGLGADSRFELSEIELREARGEVLVTYGLLAIGISCATVIALVFGGVL